MIKCAWTTRVSFLPPNAIAAALHSYVVLGCHMHWALHGARGRRELGEKKRCWLGTLQTASAPGNT